jgi:hypothetical protein
MADAGKVGKPWLDDELDAIVADYFDMLADELAGRPYTKAHHSRNLMERIGRTHRSVEFKHQNISAVLEILGLPWITGYKPKANFQKAIFPAIDRFLTQNPAVLEPPPRVVREAPPLGDIFVPPPPVIQERDEFPNLDPLRRLIRKFDPVERDHRNRILGKAGEEFVLGLERRQLIEAGYGDLAQKVRWVAAEEGDGAGYDVLSFDKSGSEKLLEVKTTNGSSRTPFFLTRNELSLATERPFHWRVYRVHMFATSPQVFVIAPPLENSVRLRPEVWHASF